MSPPIPVYWWRWKYPFRLNFGDEITAPLVERLTGRRVTWATPWSCDLVGAGSVIQKVIDARRDNCPALWGSGYMQPPDQDEEPLELRLLAVRGVRSRRRATGSDDPIVPLGDPGLLAPLLLDGPVRKRYTLGVVPHYKDVGSPVVEDLGRRGIDVRIIDVRWTPQEVAREIAACDAVISSSLHGLIFSDALGVPNAHLPLSNAVHGGLYKFRDYYSAFAGDDRYRSVRILGDGPRDPGVLVDHVTEMYTAPRDLSTIQDRLVDALREL